MGNGIAGNTFVVTGAASGIGKQIALRFAAEGGIPVIADGGIKFSGDFAKAIAAGASAQSLLDWTDEEVRSIGRHGPWPPPPVAPLAAPPAPLRRSTSAASAAR